MNEMDTGQKSVDTESKTGINNESTEISIKNNQVSNKNTINKLQCNESRLLLFIIYVKQK